MLACTPKTAEEPRPIEVHITDRSEPRSTGLADTARLETDGGRLRVRGTITVPTPCHTDLRASARATGDSLLIRVTAGDTGGMCAAVLSALDYRAATRDPPPAGSWHVKVRHTAGNRQTQAAADTVTVP